MILLISKRTYLPTYEPEFRDWKPGYSYDGTVRKGFGEALVKRILQDVTSKSHRFCDLLEKMCLLPREQQKEIIHTLQTYANQTSLPIEDISRLRQQVKYIALRHRTYRESNWALPSEMIDRLEYILESLPVSDPLVEHRWLFEDYCPSIGIEASSEGYREELARLRQYAVTEIYNYYGIDGVVRLAQETFTPRVDLYAIGDALWGGLGQKVEQYLFHFLSEETSGVNCKIAQAYFHKQFRQSGWDWLGPLIGRNDLSEFQKARLLIEARDYPKTWKVVDNLSHSIRRHYWSLFRYEGLGSGFQLVELVAQNLITVNRPRAALGALGIYGIESEDAASLAVQALELVGESNSAATNADDDLNSMVYPVQKVFDDLNRYRIFLGEVRLAELEWVFFIAFDFEPRTLRRIILKDPKVFVDVVSVAFLPEHREYGADSEPKKLDSTSQESAIRAHSLLQSYAHIDDNPQEEMDLDSLIEWVTETRRLLVEVDRVTIGEQYIGQILGSLPAESGEIRPAFVVRNLLEHVRSNNIELGVHLVMRNSRGVTSRGAESGGDQELELATKYREHAQRSANRWPRTARIFREMAESYEHEARLFDDQAERLRSGINR